MSVDRVTLNVRRDQADQVELLAKTAGQPKTVIMDTLLEYALKRASIKHLITLEFSDEGKTPPLVTTFASNGAAAESLQQEEENEEGEDEDEIRSHSHNYNKTLGKPESSGLERRIRVLSIMRELGGLEKKLTALDIRTEYRRKYNEDTGNVNSLLDTCIKAGQVKKDASSLPYHFSLVANAEP